jgi:hypothetical protein
MKNLINVFIFSHEFMSREYNNHSSRRRMFPRDTTYPIDVESGIQLGMADRQFPGSLCTLMI